MTIYEQLDKEWEFLAPHANKAITISNTARAQTDFKILPRRYACDTAVSCFLINDPAALKETVRFFDGKVEAIYVDVEEKQPINLLELAKPIIQHSKIIAIKPNDIAIESCDLLLRHKYHDDISGKNILVIGTGNLASKIALRAAERQANVYIHGRSEEKEQTIVKGINAFLPQYTTPIQTADNWTEETKKFDIVISFLSGQYWDEEWLLTNADKHTLIIDGGISNFSSHFIQQVLAQDLMIVRLDVRFALAYQFMATMNDSISFYKDVFGKVYEGEYCLVSGGYIGEEGSVIVDQISRPTQVIGIADGRGGVKSENSLTEKDQLAIQTIQNSIKTSTQ